MVGDAEELPFDDDQFDFYTIAFGIRNVTHMDRVSEILLFIYSFLQNLYFELILFYQMLFFDQVLLGLPVRHCRRRCGF